MSQAILELVHQVMTSPWVYVILVAIAAVDGFFPAVPSETAVITAGVFAAASGQPNVALIVAAATIGAFAGDHISYLIGRSSIGRLRKRAKARAVFDWAGRALHERGGLVLIIARYIPGGRTATTLTAGAVGYPLRSFSFFDAIAAASWGVYATMIGYLGGTAFRDDPIKGLLVGFGIAVAVTLAVEVGRQVRKRTAKSRTQAGSKSRSEASAGPRPEAEVGQPSSGSRNGGEFAPTGEEKTWDALSSPVRRGSSAP
jgi:membrane protein DedA with SNARE-associated domain